MIGIRQIGAAIPALVAAAFCSAQEAPDAFAKRMAFYSVPGVSIAVVVDRKIAGAEGYGVLEAGKATPVGTDTVFQAASISKPVAVIAALRLVEQGKLSLDAPINDFLKSWKVPDNRFTEQQAVTLRQIMSHSAGLTVHGFGGYGAGAAVPTVVEVLDGSGPANSVRVRVDKLPGESFRYSGGGYTVMQLAMTDVTGRSFADVMRELVLAPARTTRSAYSQPLPERERANAATGHRARGTAVPGHSHTYPEMAAAGLWTTPTDLMRLGLAVVAAANGEPGAILAPQTTKEMLTPQVGGHGLGFALADSGDGRVFTHSGANEGFRSMMFMYADGRGGAAIMTNGDRGGELIAELAASIAATYGWKFGAR